MFTTCRSLAPIVATAVHAGHTLRPAVATHMALDEATRLREEDPFTDHLVAVGGTEVVVDRSRFEVDLNRPRTQAVYDGPDSAWGLDVWAEPLPADEIEASLTMYDEFYAALAEELDVIAGRGSFLVLDIHSYNHRRGGPEAPAAEASGNPEVNVGTAALEGHRWDGLVARFIERLRQMRVDGHPLDVHENVRFPGGHLSRWVQERYDGRACPLALEFKKTFMDEWTGQVDRRHLEQLRVALAEVAKATADDLDERSP